MSPTSAPPLFCSLFVLMKRPFSPRRALLSSAVAAFALASSGAVLHAQTGSPKSAATTATPTAAIADNVVRTRIAGIDVVAYRTGVRQVVTFRGSLPAGDHLAPEKNVAIPTLVGGMLDKGTTLHDKFSIAEQLEGVGARLYFGVDENMLTFSGKCLRKDLPLVIALLAEQLRQPAFSPDEFAKFKTQLSGNLQRALESTDYRANEAFVRAIYPIGHPNRAPSTEEFLSAVQAATLEDVRAFHAEYYGPAQVTFVAVGDIGVNELKADVEKAFGGWKGGKPRTAFAKAVPPDADRDQTVFLADKTNVSVLLGQTTQLKYTDPDALPLRVGNATFGRGMTGRLMSTVRDTEGLTYGIYSSVGNDAFADGDFRISAQFSPALLEQGLASTQRELKKWYDTGITAEELARTKNDLIGSFKVGLATTDGLADSLLMTIHRGFGVEWLDEYPSKLNALTLREVNGAIKKHLDPEKMVTIKAGTVSDAPKKPSGHP